MVTATATPPDDDDDGTERPDTEADVRLGAEVGAARPAIDPFVVRVLGASAARALFGRADDVVVGRYRLLRLLGTGGGGSVYVAHDPELDRELAVKLIAAPAAEQRTRALAEGQALARLAHPNVVTVFDVGVADDRVYLAMELVRGQPLRAYAPTVGPRDVLRAYRQVGDGLVAAHAAGLVHGDFKPDNAVIGADGRVRIVDFGLAGAVGADVLGGTPTYLAPETRAGVGAAATIDQYAFAVSLAESLGAAGLRSLPRWLSAIVDRATTADPTRRYPDMAALLRALAADPRTRWRRRAMVAVPVAMVAVAFAVGRDRAPTARSRCDGGATALTVAWNSTRAAAIHDHLRGLGTPFAALAATRGPAALDRYGARWVQGYDAACRAAPHGPSTTLADRRAACLGQARNQLTATADILLATDPSHLPDALRAILELPDLDRCDDAEALLTDVEPPQPPQQTALAALAPALDRGRAAVAAATDDAIAITAAVVERARAIGHRPTLAEALLLYGRALIAHDQDRAAAAPLGEAIDLAIPARADAIAVEASARLVATFPSDARAAALAGARPMLGLAARLGRRDAFATALLYNHVGVVENAAGNVDGARAAWRHALEIARGVDTAGAVELAWVRSNLALVTADEAERGALHAEALAVVQARLGPDHPLTIELELANAFSAPSTEVARHGLRAPCARLAALHPTSGSRVVQCAYELAILDLAADAPADARASFELALAPQLSGQLDPTRQAIARAYRALLDGDAASASAQLRALAKAMAPTAATPWFELLQVADVELGLAASARADHRDVDAQAAIDRARDALARAGAGRTLPAITRRQAWAERARR